MYAAAVAINLIAVTRGRRGGGVKWRGGMGEKSELFSSLSFRFHKSGNIQLMTCGDYIGFFSDGDWRRLFN